MAKVFLKDVVQRIKDNVDKDNTQLEYYIGGEHFDSGEIRITKKGVIKGSTIGPAFHMRFQPRDVLLMSRNPHLKKAGVVDFEGICSDVSYVCRTKNEQILIQDFLPFIFQTNSFWDFAEANKKGSTNFFLNWSDFEKYEFELPSIEKQKMLADLLWSIIDVKYSYKKLYTKSNELIQSRFIEMFSNINETAKLKELSEVSGGLTKNQQRSKMSLQLPYLRVANVYFGKIDTTEILNIGLTEDEYKRTLLKTGDLLFVEGNGSPEQIGRVAVWNAEINRCVHQNHLIKARFKAKKINSVYALYYFMSQKGRNQIKTKAVSTSGLYTLSISKIEDL